MTGERIWLFDTTLRDGGQTRGIDFTVADKHFIARTLADFGLDYVEGAGRVQIPLMTSSLAKNRILVLPGWWLLV